jgi:hypothetical protein
MVLCKRFRWIESDSTLKERLIYQLKDISTPLDDRTPVIERSRDVRSLSLSNALLIKEFMVRKAHHEPDKNLRDTTLVESVFDWVPACAGMTIFRGSFKPATLSRAPGLPLPQGRWSG